MASPWSDFDEPAPLALITTPRATVNQSTGAIERGATTTTSIAGNLDEEPLDDEGRQPGGIVHAGDAILYTQTILDLDANDYTVRITIDEGSGRTRDFRVVGEERRYSWLHAKEGTPVRPSYILRRLSPE
jgi:hypothetical protein